MKSYFLNNDPIPDDFKSFQACALICDSCSSSYIGETCRHFKTSIVEHIKRDKMCSILKFLIPLF